jgi:hypothetical protein
MKTVAFRSLLLIILTGTLFSCSKKVVKEKDIVHIPTDSVYMYALVDSLSFTASSTGGVFSTEANYSVSMNSFLALSAKTGPDSNDKTISLRIDNFLNQPGTYIISPTTGGKASYSRNMKEVEIADSGKIVITSMGKSIKGTFYFYTEHFTVLNGSFSAQ